MIDNKFGEIINTQRSFFVTGKSRDIKFRRNQLKLLYSILKENENKLYDAIYKDFRKSSYDTYLTELGLVYHEISLAIKRLPKWSQTQKKPTDLSNLPGKSILKPEPLGVCLIIGAWNYPYQLSILPAVSALAAGNSVIIKPSDLSQETSKVMAEIINSNFDEGVLKVVEGGVEETTELLKNKFDKIFYTGSSVVGKIIMKAAAEHLTPVVLELGGKSPCFVIKDADIKMSAKRIVFGKFMNAGQTCVAPDYLIVCKSLKDKLIEEIKNQIEQIHGKNIEESEAFARIINKRHFHRISKLIDKSKVICGGHTNESNLYISPTLLDNVDWDDAVMQEEIFGPVLPIITMDEPDAIIQKVKERDKPLALYIFGSCTKVINKILNEISFGGGMINDTLLHLTNTNLPFGGVGYSGMGNYHGKYGFDAFTHNKAVIFKTNLFEPFVKYPPYSKRKFSIIKWLMK